MAPWKPPSCRWVLREHWTGSSWKVIAARQKEADQSKPAPSTACMRQGASSPWTVQTQ